MQVLQNVKTCGACQQSFSKIKFLEFDNSQDIIKQISMKQIIKVHYNAEICVIIIHNKLPINSDFNPLSSYLTGTKILGKQQESFCFYCN